MNLDFTGIPKIEFEAICTGDGESFCWEVDKETYLRIKGWNDELSPFDCAIIDFDENTKVIMKSDKFRIYPNDIFGLGNEKNKKMIKIEWQDI